MKYALRGITAEELSYSMNRIKMDPNTRFEIKPQFSRTIKQVKENDKLWFVSMEVKVESTEAEPKPFNLKVRLVGYLHDGNYLSLPSRSCIFVDGKCIYQSYDAPRYPRRYDVP